MGGIANANFNFHFHPTSQPNGSLGLGQQNCKSLRLHVRMSMKRSPQCQVPWELGSPAGSPGQVRGHFYQFGDVQCPWCHITRPCGIQSPPKTTATSLVPWFAPKNPFFLLSRHDHDHGHVRVVLGLGAQNPPCAILSSRLAGLVWPWWLGFSVVCQG